MLNIIKYDSKNYKVYGKCFKKGKYYLICENPNVAIFEYGKPKLTGKKYYSRFPGEDITLIEKKKKDNRYDNIK